MEKEKSEGNKLGFLLDSLHNRMKSDLMILPINSLVIEAPKPNKYGYISKNGCKSKKELRAWVQLQNKERKTKTHA